jgi:hypothetical protein
MTIENDIWKIVDNRVTQNWSNGGAWCSALSASAGTARIKRDFFVESVTSL